MFVISLLGCESWKLRAVAAAAAAAATLTNTCGCVELKFEMELYTLLFQLREVLREKEGGEGGRGLKFC